MKFKTAYIYIIILIMAVAALLIFTNTGNDTEKVNVNIENKEMPEDDIHQNLGEGNVPGTPNKQNVREDFWKKMDSMKTVVEANPEDTSAMKEYADILAAAHKQEDAITYYNRILNIDPKRTDVLFGLSLIYYNKRQLDKAEEITNKIIQYDKDNYEAIYNLGAIAASQGNIGKAKDIWVNLIKQHPNTKTAELAQKSLDKLNSNQ